MSGRAAIYTRISKDREGTELGVERQEADCRDLASSKGLDVVAVFSDNNISASTKSHRPRPGYDEMIASARKGELDAILAYSNSRLTRRGREFEDLIELHEKHGVEIHTVASGSQNLSKADGRAVLRTIAAWDIAEAERTSERIKRQKRQRAESGSWHGGAPPFGYIASDGTLQVNPTEAELVREATRRLLAGDTLHGIVTSWNGARSESDPSPRHTTRSGVHWRQTNLRSILTNRSLLGETKAGVRGWEPLLDEAEFEQLRRIFDRPERKVTHSPGVRGGRYSLSGVVVCGACGKRLTTHGKRGRTTLACLARVNGPDEAHPRRWDAKRQKWLDQFRPTVDHDRLEKYVFTTVAEALRSDPEWLEAVRERDPKTNAKIASYQAKRDALLEDQRKVNDMYVENLADLDWVRERVEAIKAESESLRKKIADLQARPVLAQAVAEGIRWESWSSDRRRNFLTLSGARIEIGPWPRGKSNAPARRKTDTDETYRLRTEDYHQEVLGLRVKITPPTASDLL